MFEWPLSERGELLHFHARVEHVLLSMHVWIHRRNVRNRYIQRLFYTLSCQCMSGYTGEMCETGIYKDCFIRSLAHACLDTPGKCAKQVYTRDCFIRSLAHACLDTPGKCAKQVYTKIVLYVLLPMHVWIHRGNVRNRYIQRLFYTFSCPYMSGYTGEMCETGIYNDCFIRSLAHACLETPGKCAKQVYTKIVLYVLLPMHAWIHRGNVRNMYIQRLLYTFSCQCMLGYTGCVISDMPTECI